MGSDFFKSIPQVTRFISVVDDQNFQPVPADWIIVIADIKDSTKAVADGRYKDVNMIGGAVICAVQNATGNRDWPFVFGGDGATLLIESSERAVVEQALVRTRTLASQDFDLSLRIAFVPVADVRAQGLDVLVARYEITAGSSLAMFGGGGVELADQLVKATATADDYLVPEYTLPGRPDLTGLSCRWEPLTSQKGVILCLLIKPLAGDFHQRQVVLSEFLSRLTGVIGTELKQASPVTAQSMKLRWPPKGLMAEARATRAEGSLAVRFAAVALNSLFQWVLERFKLSAGGYDANTYREEVRRNSDFCKFDDVLRMVLDCTAEQVREIRLILDEMNQQDAVDFGVFETRKALMTCLLFDLHSSEHLHFIDGADGGFYSASQGLKSHVAARQDKLGK